MVEERAETGAPDQQVATVGVGEQEHGAAVPGRVAMLADGLGEGPETARQFDAGDGVGDRGRHAERVDVVARGERPAAHRRRAGKDRDPLVQVAVAQDLRPRFDAPLEIALDIGLAGALEEPGGVADQRRDVVDGNEIAGAAERGGGCVGGGHDVPPRVDCSDARQTARPCRARSGPARKRRPQGSGLDRARRRASLPAAELRASPSSRLARGRSGRGHSECAGSHGLARRSPIDPAQAPVASWSACRACGRGGRGWNGEDRGSRSRGCPPPCRAPADRGEFGFVAADAAGRARRWIAKELVWVRAGAEGGPGRRHRALCASRRADPSPGTRQRPPPPERTPGMTEASRRFGRAPGGDAGNGSGFPGARRTTTADAGRRFGRAAPRTEERSVAGPPPRREWRLHRGPPYHDRSTRHGHRRAADRRM